MKRSRLLKFGVAAALLIVAGIIMAWCFRPCVDMGNIPVQFISGQEFPVLTFSEAKQDSFLTFEGFSSFVTDITEHLASKLDQENLCLNSAESKERSLLQFYYWVVDTKRQPPLPQVPPLKEKPYGVCRITSPWADIVIERKPVPMVRGIFRWNERQVLADQAVLAGALDVPPGVAMPVSYEEFRSYAEFDYGSLETGGGPVENSIEEIPPPDMQWLYRHYDNPGLGYGFRAGAGGTSLRAFRMRQKSYTKIVITLIDRCFESEGKDIHYNSILDVDDPQLLEEYRIDGPIVLEPEQ